MSALGKESPGASQVVDDVEEVDMEPSELGTKEYWETVYDSELSRTRGNDDEEGDVWLGEESLRIVMTWMRRQKGFAVDPETDKVLDVGCGSGVLCLQLLSEGFRQVVGIDYSSKAVQVAKKYAAGKKLDGAQYEVADILDLQSSPTLAEHHRYRVCIDMGTYDAISLNPDDAKEKRQRYVTNIHKLLRDDGLFCIVSCNWTQAELRKHFDEGFLVTEVLPTPQFVFKSVAGNVYSAVVFTKKTGSITERTRNN